MANTEKNIDEIKEMLSQALGLLADYQGEDGEGLIIDDWQDLQGAGYLTNDEGFVVNLDCYKNWEDVGEDDDPSEIIGKRRFIIRLEEVDI